jgi:hypothetical protein
MLSISREFAPLRGLTFAAWQPLFLTLHVKTGIGVQAGQQETHTEEREDDEQEAEQSEICALAA